MYAKVIRHALIDQDMSQKDLADKLGQKWSNFSHKMVADNFSESEMKAIADALGMELKISMVPKTSKEDTYNVRDLEMFYTTTYEEADNSPCCDPVLDFLHWLKTN